jgi:alanine racemase
MRGVLERGTRDWADTHAVVDLHAIRQNCRTLSVFADKPVLAPIKANAYGHGATRVARALEADVLGFAVATATEAMELRAAQIVKDIVLLTRPRLEVLSALVHHRVSFVVSSLAELEVLAREAFAQRESVQIHLKVNTGLNRLGAEPDDAARLLLETAKHPFLALTGVMTHLVDSEDAHPEWAAVQIERFAQFLETHRVSVPYRHAANTGGVLNRSLNAHFDLIRPGIGLYGYAPGADMEGIVPLTPAMTLNAPVLFVKPLEAGQPVSYNAKWVAPKPTRVATVRLGYADGYPRALSGKASAILGGRVVPQVGRVCMDQLLLDIDTLEAEVGDTATFFGALEITAQHVADWAGTNSYEILTGIGSRVERVYVDSEV